MKKSKMLEWEVVDKSLLQEYIAFISDNKIEVGSDNCKQLDFITEKIIFNLIANSKKDLMYSSILRLRVISELNIMLIESTHRILKETLESFNSDIDKLSKIKDE